FSSDWTISVSACSASRRVLNPPCHFCLRLPLSPVPTSTTAYQSVWTLPPRPFHCRLWMWPRITTPSGSSWGRPSAGRRRAVVRSGGYAPPLEEGGDGNHEPSSQPAGGQLPTTGRLVRCAASDPEKGGGLIDADRSAVGDLVEVGKPSSVPGAGPPVGGVARRRRHHATATRTSARSARWRIRRTVCGSRCQRRARSSVPTPCRRDAMTSSAWRGVIVRDRTPSAIT